MSFYDDASLVFLPSGGAGKDGKAYSIKPVPEYGNELVTNGGFDTDSSWLKGTGWTISGGTASCDGTQTSNSELKQQNGVLGVSLTIEVGKTYRVSLTTSNITSGVITSIEVGGSYSNDDISTNGNHSVYITATSTNNRFTIAANSSFIGSIDNVSLKEVIVDGDFTFSRGSNLTATRVDSNGLIEKGRENLLTYSNEFDNAIWQGTDVTSGQSGYDGSSDAFLVGGGLRQNLSYAGVVSLSAYIKAGTATECLLRMDAGTDARIFVDLATGLLIYQDPNVIAYSIDAVSGATGWYRISFSANITSGVNVRIIATESNVPVTDNIYIQDAQLELGTIATEYIESGATTGLAGILEDSPRFDYSGGASCPSLLLEPSRTNIVPISEGIPEDTNAVTLTENYGTSPEGVQNSLKVQKDGVTSNDRIHPIDNYNATLVSGTSYSVSAFVKNIDVDNGGLTTIGCRINGGSLFRLAYEWTGSSLAKNTTTGSSTGTRANEICEDYGNGWWRIGFSFEADNTQSNIEIDVDRANSSATTSIETYGWQLEQGSYPTSYIPNHSGGSVTREADVYQNTDIDTVTNMSTDECTVFLDVDLPQGREGSTPFLQFFDVAGGGSTYFGLKGLYVPSPIIQVFGTGTINISGTHSLSVGRHKIAIRWLSGTAKVFIDGAEVSALSVTDSSAPTSFDKVLGRGEGYRHLVHQLIVFDNSLSITDLEILTGTSYDTFSAMATALNYTTYE